MSILTILDTILIGPLKLVFEIIFGLMNRPLNNPGLTIVILSLTINFLVLPLYRRADAMQEQTRDAEARLSKGIDHIKKVFSGDERMMILQTYYRQNHYSPFSALNGTLSLLLEIPFFMAAYQFLSHVPALNGATLGPIMDLGAPDGLLVLGSISVNVLPILMTLINVVSSAIYLKGFPLKTKIQLYAMAAFFMVFLYDSPAGLVFYWTLNNLFSLVKNIFYKLKDPRKVLATISAVLGPCIQVYALFLLQIESIKLKLLMLLLGLALEFVAALYMLRNKLPRSKTEPKPNRKLFLLGSLFMALLLGVLIPSSVLSASPKEFVDVTYFHHPLWYQADALCIASGMFLVWLQVFYYLSSPKGKVIFERAVWVLCGLCMINYMFYGEDSVTLSSILQYESAVAFSSSEQVQNLLVLFGAGVLMYLAAAKWPKRVASVLLTAVLAIGCMGIWNTVTVYRSVAEMIALVGQQDEQSLQFPLSKTGKNVVVIMLDRALGEYTPYIFAEKPELLEQFSGFTYYPNTISFAHNTISATPALFGGYEYTPVEMNRRQDIPQVEKHNEALKVMPVLFSENAFDVTVVDPVFANYWDIPDLSIFDDYPQIQALSTKGAFQEEKQKEEAVELRHRNLFCYGLMKVLPEYVQLSFYYGANYCQVAYYSDNYAYYRQNLTDLSNSIGMNGTFIENYNVLSSLGDMTQIVESDSNTFMYMVNDATHSPTLLQTPDYVPQYIVDNTEYDRTNAQRFTLDGRTLKMETGNQITHYHCNMATMLKLGEWFDYLRENDVYDNTRIILVADHGVALRHTEELVLQPENLDTERYLPLLMVKDFDSTDFTVNEEFMTNADVPTLATEGLVENPVNPFTGNPIENSEKTAHDQYIMISDNWTPDKNKGNTFLSASWASVREDRWDMDNWKLYPELAILTEHAFP